MQSNRSFKLRFNIQKVYCFEGNWSTYIQLILNIFVSVSNRRNGVYYHLCNMYLLFYFFFKKMFFSFSKINLKTIFYAIIFKHFQYRSNKTQTLNKTQVKLFLRVVGTEVNQNIIVSIMFCNKASLKIAFGCNHMLLP